MLAQSIGVRNQRYYEHEGVVTGQNMTIQNLARSRQIHETSSHRTYSYFLVADYSEVAWIA